MGALRHGDRGRRLHRVLRNFDDSGQYNHRFYSHPPHNGAGIGLALCKEIMGAWRAHIRCVSRESAYAIFVLEFPVR